MTRELTRCTLSCWRETSSAERFRVTDDITLDFAVGERLVGRGARSQPPVQESGVSRNRTASFASSGGRLIPAAVLFFTVS
jgi:hypothetical protein